jgi:hypothetical protein
MYVVTFSSVGGPKTFSWTLKETSTLKYAFGTAYAVVSLEPDLTYNDYFYNTAEGGYDAMRVPIRANDYAGFLPQLSFQLNEGENVFLAVGTSGSYMQFWLLFEPIPAEI